ncbi:MAG: alpha/beta fold hydrolase [bacterium]|nr:alpha/beta fold hydrolase [bacterium]
MRNSQNKEIVVLIHGLARSKYSMWYLAKKLNRQGFATILFGYPSRSENISTLVEILHQFIKQKKLSDKQIYFVTHSLGSIIAKRFVSKYSDHFNFKRAIHLGPPHRGSQTANFLKRFWLIRKLMGPAFIELSELVSLKDDPKIETGIIAGIIPFKKGYYFCLDSSNDGIVTVDETKLPGSKDHTTIKGSHSFLMYQSKVINLTLEFLKTGSFTQ